eukprot:5709719-Alexandrium_andersonii.AAC.1
MSGARRPPPSPRGSLPPSFPLLASLSTRAPLRLNPISRMAMPFRRAQRICLCPMPPATPRAVGQDVPSRAAAR